MTTAMATAIETANKTVLGIKYLPYKKTNCADTLFYEIKFINNKAFTFEECKSLKVFVTSILEPHHHDMNWNGGLIVTSNNVRLVVAILDLVEPEAAKNFKESPAYDSIMGY